MFSRCVLHDTRCGDVGIARAQKNNRAPPNLPGHSCNARWHYCLLLLSHDCTYSLQTEESTIDINLPEYFQFSPRRFCHLPWLTNANLLSIVSLEGQYGQFSSEKERDLKKKEPKKNRKKKCGEGKQVTYPRSVHAVINTADFGNGVENHFCH